MEALGVARREPQSGLVRAVWPQKGHVPKQIHRGLLGLDFKGPQSYSMLGDSLAADLLDALRHVRMQYGAWILSLSVSPMLADAYAMTFQTVHDSLFRDDQVTLSLSLISDSAAAKVVSVSV